MLNCGFSGIIQAAAVCRLSSLHVLVLNRNELRGVIPECVESLSLRLLWLSDNNFHGPISELSVLGQYLKNLDSINLARNRWAGLLESEKLTLHDIAAPLAVPQVDHNWDFSYSYDFTLTFGLVIDASLTAEREETYRHWSAGSQFQSFWVPLASDFPWHDQKLTDVVIGQDGSFLVTRKGNGNSLSLYVAIEDELTWGEAREYCRTHHYDLAATHSGETAEALAAACASVGDTHGSCWIGGNDVETEGVFEWSDGSDFGYENWSGGEVRQHNLTRFHFSY
jgi:hypothetical protein